jgi:hypothetical protein
MQVNFEKVYRSELAQKLIELRKNERDMIPVFPLNRMHRDTKLGIVKIAVLNTILLEVQRDMYRIEGIQADTIMFEDSQVETFHVAMASGEAASEHWTSASKAKMAQEVLEVLHTQFVPTGWKEPWMREDPRDCKAIMNVGDSVVEAYHLKQNTVPEKKYAVWPVLSIDMNIGPEDTDRPADVVMRIVRNARMVLDPAEEFSSIYRDPLAKWRVTNSKRGAETRDFRRGAEAELNAAFLKSPGWRQAASESLNEKGMSNAGGRPNLMWTTIGELLLSILMVGKDKFNEGPAAMREELSSKGREFWRPEVTILVLAMVNTARMAILDLWGLADYRMFSFGRIGVNGFNEMLFETRANLQGLIVQQRLDQQRASTMFEDAVSLGLKDQLFERMIEDSFKQTAYGSVGNLMPRLPMMMRAAIATVMLDPVSICQGEKYTRLETAPGMIKFISNGRQHEVAMKRLRPVGIQTPLLTYAGTTNNRICVLQVFDTVMRKMGKPGELTKLAVEGYAMDPKKPGKKVYPRALDWSYPRSAWMALPFDFLELSSADQLKLALGGWYRINAEPIKDYQMPRSMYEERNIHWSEVVMTVWL